MPPRCVIFLSEQKLILKSTLINSGIVVRKWGQLSVGRRMEATTVMIANSVSVRRKISDSLFSTEEMKDIFKNYWERYRGNPLLGRDNILASICPQVKHSSNE